MKKLEFIDALRAYAILAVILVHTSQHIKGLPTWLKNIASDGQYGVQLFYIVSACTLFLSLSWRGKEERNPIYFFMRRFFRIAPLFYLAIIFYLLKDGLGHRFWLGDEPRITGWNILSTVCFVNGWNPHWLNSVIGVNWSVAVEMTFYLFVPLLYRYTQNLHQAIWLTFIALVVSDGFQTFFSSHLLIKDRTLWHNYLYMWFPNQLPIFCLGIVLFYILKENLSQINKELSYPLLVISLVTMYALSQHADIAFVQKHFLYGIAFILFAYSLCLYPNRLFVNRVIVYIGKISFSIYLSHWGVLSVTSDWFAQYIRHRLILPVWGLTALYTVTLLISIAVSTTTYYFVEKQGINLGRKCIEKLKLWPSRRKKDLLTTNAQ